MKQMYGNLWKFPADALCITTNGNIKRDGTAVMGRGTALQAAQKYSWLPRALGCFLRKEGLATYPIGTTEDGKCIVAFPVKYRWQEAAELDLIESSTLQLQRLADRMGWKNVVLPRPGCGNGQRKWEQVQLIIDPYLDDRFTVVELHENKDMPTVSQRA